MKIRPVGAELLHPDSEKDRHDKLIPAFETAQAP